MNTEDPFRAVDAAARALARDLLDGATFAALGVVQEGVPVVTRIAFATTAQGAPLSLVSSLSPHTAALERSAACSLLIGEPEDRGDPLTHPRLTIQATARFIARETDLHATLRDRFLALRPKARLYVDFTDFRFVCFDIEAGFLNGGFGRAFKLAASDFSVSS